MTVQPWRLFRFLAVGAANTLVDFGLFNLLAWLTGAQGATLVWLNGFSITVAACQSFFLHRSWTFPSGGKVKRQAALFFLCTGCGILLNSLVVFLALKFENRLPLAQLWLINGGKVLGTLCSAAWNFFCYKYLVFPEAKRLAEFPQEGKKGLVSVIIPAYNEERRLGERLASLTGTLPSFFPTEIIVADDGSSDATRSIAQRWASACPFVKFLGYDQNAGKGEAVRLGMNAACGEYLLFTDSDATFTPGHLRAVVEALASGAEVVVGRRRCGKGRLEGESGLRRFLGVCFNVLVRCFFLPGIADSQCGLKGFTREAAKKVFSKQTLRGFAFDVELLALAQRQQLELRQLPIAAKAAAGSKVKLASCFEMAWELLHLKVNLLFNRYSLERTRQKYAEAALTVGLFAVSFAVRLPWLWEVPRFIDELREVDLAHEIFRGQAWPLHNAAWDIGALHNYILAGIFQAFGPNIWWPRLYVAVTSALTVVLIYKLGKLLFGKAAGLLAAACLAANGMHILVTHMAWSNSTTPFFFALALYGTLKAEKRGSGLGLPVGFLWALALQTHSSVIIYVLAVAGYLAKKDRLRKAVPAGIGFLLGYGNMIYFNLVSHFGSVAWLSRKTYTLEQQPGIFSFCRNAGRMLVQYLRTVSSTYFEAANPLAYLEQPQFVLAAVALLLGCCLAKKEGKNLPLWLLAASFATIPWLNTRYSFYLPTRYIMPVALVGILLMAKGGIGLWDFLFKNKTARICAGTGTLILLILQLVPHYRYCRSLAGTDMANTTAFAITQQARRLAGGRGIVFVDPSLPVENDPLPVLFKLAGQNQAKLTRSLPAANSRTTPQLAVLSKASFIRLKGTAPLKLRKKFTCRLARAGEKKREIYLVELNAQRGVPVGGWR